MTLVFFIASQSLVLAALKLEKTSGGVLDKAVTAIVDSLRGGGAASAVPSLPAARADDEQESLDVDRC